MISAIKFNDSALDSFEKFSVVRVDNVRFNKREQTIWFSTRRTENIYYDDTNDETNYSNLSIK